MKTGSVMRVETTEIPGLLMLYPTVHRDDRGTFVKPFDAAAFAEAGLSVGFAETFHTLSGEGVVRGMHLQLPPEEQHKVVYCASGRALDVLVDLRVGSPAYGRVVAVEMGEADCVVAYVPPGIAHGFCVPSGRALMVYQVSAAYAPALDTGVRWDSIGFDWPVASPILSERDRALPPMDEFRSPFVWQGDDGR